MKLSVLLLEDDLELSDTVAAYLSHNGYEVVQCFDVEQARERIYEKRFDLWLLDVKLPRQNGIDFLESIRAEGVDTPAIFITSLHGVEDATRGFSAGADDYIRKPFALKELHARIEAILKRRYPGGGEKIAIDTHLTFDPIELCLEYNGKMLPLKPKEARLLALFLQNPDKILTKETIFRHLWDYDEVPNEGSLRTFVKVLRKHIGKERIQTVKDVGYRFLSKN